MGDLLDLLSSLTHTTHRTILGVHRVQTGGATPVHGLEREGFFPTLQTPCGNPDLGVNPE